MELMSNEWWGNEKSKERESREKMRNKRREIRAVWGNLTQESRGSLGK